MHELPHHYTVEASAGPDGQATLWGDSLDTIPFAAPVGFGGPGNQWSPEALLVAAVASCFILSFRAIARASKLSWMSLKCDVDGTLERVDGAMKFTTFVVRPTLEVPQDTDEERAHRLLEKAEQTCLITNSLSGETQLDARVLTTP
ncbi:MAG: OsmC family protein [Rhodanobacteraceae bacterium]